MKTEKRLTMALSVLVALMMLAVPLASSSNLFVDGGQTNSNGDAPSLGAASYRVDFILNEGSEGRISLDKVTGIDLSTLNDKFTDESNKAVFYQDKDGNLFAVVTGDVTIQQLIWALTTSVGTDSATFSIAKTGYILDSFVNNDSKAAFGPDKTNSTKPDTDKGDKITKNMTLTATWLLEDSKYAEIPVDVMVDGELFKEYVKVYELANEKNVSIYTEGTFVANGVKGINDYGVVVNHKDGTDILASEELIYSFKTTYGDKELSKEIASGAAIKIPVSSKLVMTYTFDSQNFSKIVVSSIAFKDGKDVTVFADKNRGYTYGQVLDALRFPYGDDESQHDIKAAIVLKDLKKAGETNSVYFKDGKAITENGYEISGWNEGAQLLQSENNASSPLTLDAELNGYYVLFMSKGQYEYVYVPFGELSADKTKLDIAGVNHWVYIDYDTYAGTSLSISEDNIFSSFSDSVVRTIDGKVTSSYDGKSPMVVFVACFDSRGSTGYAVFDASNADGNSGNFGNEYVDKIVIPGKVGNSIPLPSSNPVYNDENSRTVFLGWKNNTNSYSSTDEYTSDIKTYTATPQPYIYTITFYDGNNVVGVLYYNEAAPTTDLDATLVAFEYDGNVYAKGDLTSKTPDINKAANDAYNSIVTPDKAGYYITQWNDADKNKVIEFKWKDGKIEDIKTDVKDMKDDLNLYAQFKAEKYDIEYTNTYGNVGSMTQTASVDETVKLYSDSTFVYNGYKLTGWSDRPDGDGTSYKLGDSFTLNGEQFEDLKDGKFTLYAVWESTGSVTPGGSSGGDDSNTDTYLLAGILIVIIVLILVVAVVLRKKQ